MDDLCFTCGAYWWCVHRGGSEAEAAGMRADVALDLTHLDYAAMTEALSRSFQNVHAAMQRMNEALTAAASSMKTALANLRDCD